MNPKLNKFVEENSNITLLGLAWALFWRLYVAIIGATILLSVLLTAFN